MESLQYLEALCKDVGRPYDEFTRRLDKLRRAQPANTQQGKFMLILIVIGVFTFLSLSAFSFLHEFSGSVKFRFTLVESILGHRRYTFLLLLTVAIDAIDCISHLHYFRLFISLNFLTYKPPSLLIIPPHQVATFLNSD